MCKSDIVDIIETKSPAGIGSKRFAEKPSFVVIIGFVTIYHTRFFLLDLIAIYGVIQKEGKI
jgi:hypothetical protein